LSGAQFFVQSGPKVDNGGEGAVAIVHRRVQLLVDHLDRGGLFGGGSTVAWGGSGDRFRLHLVACARTRSARDGRCWPSLPWGGRGCIARHQGKRTGRMQAGRAQRATWAQATRSRGETLAGPKQAGRAALCSRQASLWGAVGGYCGRGGPRARRYTGEANKVSRAPERLGWRCRLGCGWGGGSQVRWRHRSDGGARRLEFRLGVLAMCSAG